MFTTGELAVLKIIADAVRTHGRCCDYLDAIVARSGTSRSTVQRALRVARALGLITVIERHRRGLPSLTNMVKVISREWLAWLRRGPGGGCQISNPTVRQVEH